MIVCPQPRAADVGAAVLQQGGTAFDAAIATAFAQMVVDPFMCGLGGMGTLLWHDAASGTQGMVDFHTRAGSGVRPEMWADDCAGRSEISAYSLFDDFRSELGYTAIMTPGTVAGFGAFHAAKGTMAWPALLAPAAQIAREGWALTPYVLDFWSREPMLGLPDGLRRLTTTAACAEIYLRHDGSLPPVGEVIRNPDLADTIVEIADGGADGFYRGALATRIAADLEDNGAFVTAADLAAYRAETPEPVRGRYRGFEVVSNPPPGSGCCLIQMLQVLAHFDLAAMGHGSADHLDTLARVMAHCHGDRNRLLADPLFADVPVERFVSPDRAAEIAADVRQGKAPPLHSPSPEKGTTHLSVADAAGNAVSVTHTLGTGSGVVTPGLGFVYNNSMKLADPIPGRANSFAPGKARTTGMVPTMLLEDGKPVVIVGALGGSVIISAVLQSILNMVDFAMSPAEAVAAPRIHCEGGDVHAEARVEGAVVAALEARGHRVQHSPHSYDPVMARAHAIRVGTGGWQGGADPRHGGGVAFARA